MDKIPLYKMEDNAWYMLTTLTLSFKNRLKLLFGYKNLTIGFFSPDGNCHAACHFEFLLSKKRLEDIKVDFKKDPKLYIEKETL